MFKDGDDMANGSIESFETVEIFLDEMKKILSSEKFNIDDDFFLIQGVKVGSTGYKNTSTMLALGYDRSDICETLRSLEVYDYCETLPDEQYPLQSLQVFSKTISELEIYIKINIVDRDKSRVFILSFHFADYPMKKAYYKQNDSGNRP